MRAEGRWRIAATQSRRAEQHVLVRDAADPRGRIAATPSRPDGPARGAPGLARRRTLVLAAVSALAGRSRAQAPPSPDALLLAAATSGDVVAVKRLLAAGASTAARDAQGRTALLAATYGNHVEAARPLIAAGADVNARDPMQNSAFLLAVARGHLQILKLTLAAGADLKSTNRYGGTALIPACHYGHVETVRELLKTTIDVDHVNRLGWTALLEAVILSDGGAAHLEIVRLLIHRGANLNLADRDGITPLAHARRRGFTQIAELLARAGAR